MTIFQLFFPQAGHQFVVGTLLASLLVFSTGGRTEVRLPDMGDSTAGVFSSAEEAVFRRAFLRSIRASLDIVEDPEVEEYIGGLGHRLVEASDGAGSSFNFFMVADKAINAFAGPGGVIAANTGLILSTETESEFAAVIAHEIAHVTQRHLARSIEAADRSNLPALAGMLAAIIIGSQNAEMGKATAAAVGAFGTQMQLDFTRANEKEADRVGIQILAKAELDPRAVPNFFERLQQAYRYYSEPPEFLSTHPVTTNRIADSRGRAEQYPYRQFRDSHAYLMVRAKLRVLTAAEPREVLRHFADQLASGRYRDQTATRYGHALALMAVEHWSAANRELQGLLVSGEEQAGILIAMAQTEEALGRKGKAERRYRHGLDLFPGNRGMERGLIKLLLKAGRMKEAKAALREYRELGPVDGIYYRLLAEAYGLGREQAASYLALAEHHYYYGRLDIAIQQLHLARKAAGDTYYEASRIDARMVEWQHERMQRAEILK